MWDVTNVRCYINSNVRHLCHKRFMSLRSELDITHPLNLRVNTSMLRTSPFSRCYWFPSAPCHPCFSGSVGHFSGSCRGEHVSYSWEAPHITEYSVFTTYLWVSVVLVSDLQKLLTHPDIFCNRCYSSSSSPVYLLPESVSSTPLPWFFSDLPDLGSGHLLTDSQASIIHLCITHISSWLQ